MNGPHRHCRHDWEPSFIVNFYLYRRTQNDRSDELEQQYPRASGDGGPRRTDTDTLQVEDLISYTI